MQLYIGLWCFGLAGALQVRSDLGLDPWDVFHQGLANHVGLAIGTVVIIVGAAVLLLWIPLRQRPGLGTISNMILIGVSMNTNLELLPHVHTWFWRGLYLVAGVLLCGIATGMYIGTHFGPGPRDGLMTGLARRTGRSIRLTRTTLELSVLIAGWLLGGTVGIGTVLFALAIGPLAQLFMRIFDTEAARPSAAMAGQGPATPQPATGAVTARLSRRPAGPARWRGGRRPSRTPDGRPRTRAADRTATPD